MLDALTAADARRWAVLTRSALAARRAEIDALNVYPVPDGDTGTNLYLTLDAALDAVRSEHEGAGVLGRASLEQECSALARSMLLTARGNSGVILSQLVRGFAEAIAQRGVEVADADTIADGMVRASERAFEAVTRPVRGTILTVAQAAADAGRAAAARGLSAVAEEALDAATEALRATTAQLAELARAGVVDAGGAGYVLLLEALARVVREDASHVGARVEPFAEEAALRRRSDWSHAGPAVPPVHGPVAGAAVGAAVEGGAAGGDEPAPGDGPAYEVMYLLRDSDDAGVAVLREQLDALGDSLLVVGGPDVWNVHVHVDDVGAALEAGLDAGRPYRVRVTHFREQGARQQPVSRVAVVACAAGPGLAAALEDAGARVLASGPGGRASAGQLLEAARSTHAMAVLVLPNDRDTVMAAEAAARAAQEDGLEVHVVPSSSAVQGLAALAVFDPGTSASRNAAQMGAAAAATRHGAVAVATKEALTSAGTCRPGDVLGAVAGDVVVIGADLVEVAEQVASRLLSSGGELVTVVSGEQAAEGAAEELTRRIERAHRGVEVSVVHGGQPHYPFLLGVE